MSYSHWLTDFPDAEVADLSVEIKVTEECHISQARQTAREIAREIGFREIAVSYVATSVSELATNLIFHATQGGTIKLAALKRGDKIGIEIIAEDQGPGIPNIQQALKDGFSTNGGLGGGLPGVKRLMDEFELTSKIGAGTRIVARKWQPCKLRL